MCYNTPKARQERPRRVDRSEGRNDEGKNDEKDFDFAGSGRNRDFIRRPAGERRLFPLRGGADAHSHQDAQAHIHAYVHRHPNA